MKDLFQKGDIKHYHHLINENDFARFDTGTVHEVYATFALARDAEWACRAFVLEMKEDNEEGIGTHVNIEHKSPAFKGDIVLFEARFEEILKGEIICSFQAKVNDRIIALGTTGQRILPKSKIQEIFAKWDHRASR